MPAEPPLGSPLPPGNWARRLPAEGASLGQGPPQPQGGARGAGRAAHLPAGNSGPHGAPAPQPTRHRISDGADSCRLSRAPCSSQAPDRPSDTDTGIWVRNVGHRLPLAGPGPALAVRTAAAIAGRGRRETRGRTGRHFT